MAEYSIQNITPKDDKVLDDIRVLLEMMYSEMTDFGLILPLVDDGGEKWINGIRPTLGRLSILLSAEFENQVVGFAHGALRFLPDHLGKELTGIVTHIFVEPDHRNREVASKLLKGLEDWFHQKGVTSIDLQVVYHNDPAKKFWQKNGYLPELVQFRKAVK